MWVILSTKVDDLLINILTAVMQSMWRMKYYMIEEVTQKLHGNEAPFRSVLKYTNILLISCLYRFMSP